MIPKSRTKGSI